jgi:hypothetical protein
MTLDRRHSSPVFSHHVDQLDPGQNGLGRGRRLEAEHGSNPTLDASMILFDPVIIRHE